MSESRKPPHQPRPISETNMTGGFHYGWIVIIMGLLTTVGAHGFGRFAYSMINPSMIDGLGLSYTQVGNLAAGNFIGYLLFAIIGGFLAARLGPRLVIGLSLALMGVTMILTGLAKTFGFALTMRILTGLGNGGAFVPAMALGSIWFAEKKRGLATGVVTAGIGIGFALSGLLVPPILSTYGGEGWRFCWYYLGTMVLVLAAVSYGFVRNRPEDLGLIPLGSKSSHVESTPQETDKLDWREVYRIGPVWHLGIVYFLFGFSYIIYMTFFTKYLIAEGGYTQEAAGRLFMLMGWLSLLCGLIWGWASDIIGRKGALVIVYLIHTLAFGLFALWPSPPGFTISAVMFGLSAWSIPAIVAATCGDLLGPRLAPAGLGFVTLFFGIGQAAGPSAAGAAADAAGSLAPALLLAAGVALLGAVGALLLRNSALAQAGGQASRA